VLGFWRGFHGKTGGVLGLLADDFKHGLGPLHPGLYSSPYAHCYRCSFEARHPDCDFLCARFLRQKLRHETTNDVAAIIVEPVQGTAGNVVPPPGYLARLKAFAEEIGALLIADEMITGFGRTGRMFGCDHDGVVPDIMTIGKGFGNGYPVTATVYSDKLKEKMEHVSSASSYGGNPVACASALACIEVMREEGILEHVVALGDYMLKRLKEFEAKYGIVGNTRGKGALLGIELVKDRKTRAPNVEACRLVYRKAFERGVAWIPSNQNLRLSPPLIMPIEVAAKALDIVEEAIAETDKELGN
jgi:4-aminobutyrate aminotransferase-like enzyme